jgi:GNAT superfamily N-acetyltransferase
MIKLKDILLENDDVDIQKMKSETESFRQSLKSKYPQLQNLFFFLITSQPDVLEISELRVKEEFRRQGIGAKVMQEIVDFADDHNLIVVLHPSPDSIRYKKKLEKFYKQFGFEWNKGRKMDFRLSGLFGYNMVRRPKGKKI